MGNEEDRRSFVRYSEEKVDPVVNSSKLQMSVEKDFDIALGANIQESLGVKGEGIAITAPQYTVLTKGKLKVGWALIDDDYFYQIELMEKTRLSDQDVMGAIITAFKMVVPDSIEVYIQPPPEGLDWPLWTFVAKKAGKLFGGKDFMERKLPEKIMMLRFW